MQNNNTEVNLKRYVSYSLRQSKYVDFIMDQKSVLVFANCSLGCGSIGCGTIISLMFAYQTFDKKKKKLLKYELICKWRKRL